MSERLIRPRKGDLEAACEPHASVPSGEYAGRLSGNEICDLCGLSRTNKAMHPNG